MSCDATGTGPRPPPTGSPCASARASWVPGPPTLLLQALGAMTLLHLLLPGATLAAPGWRLLALLPLAAGVALNLLADGAFKRAGTTVKPQLESTALVTAGAFAVTRNPMYLGMALLLAGLWLALGSLTPGFPVIAFALLIDRYYVRPEEEKLARIFGARYTAYRRQVRRWL